MFGIFDISDEEPIYYLVMDINGNFTSQEDADTTYDKWLAEVEGTRSQTGKTQSGENTKTGKKQNDNIFFSSTCFALFVNYGNTPTTVSHKIRAYNQTTDKLFDLEVCEDNTKDNIRFFVKKDFNGKQLKFYFRLGEEIAILNLKKGLKFYFLYPENIKEFEFDCARYKFFFVADEADNIIKKMRTLNPQIKNLEIDS